MSVTRRELKPFASFADAVADAERLLAGGYGRAGNWSLGQCCGHLARWLDYQIDGFPKAPLLRRPVAFLLRYTLAPRLLDKAIRSGRMSAGGGTIPQSVPPADADDAQGVADYKRAAERWQAHTGPLLPSPLFGDRPREDWLKVHQLHAAHHLSFLVPR